MSVVNSKTSLSKFIFWNIVKMINTLCTSTHENDRVSSVIWASDKLLMIMVLFLFQELNGFEDSVDNQPVVNGFADEEVNERGFQ